MRGECEIDDATELQQARALGKLSGSEDDLAVLAAVTGSRDRWP